MKEGDWIVIYSPKLDMDDKEPYQHFTAVGKIKDGHIYKFDMGNGFVPYRLDVDYKKVNDIPIHPLLNRLSFTKNRTNWGYSFRFGHLEFTKDDFLIIADSMKLNLPLLI